MKKKTLLSFAVFLLIHSVASAQQDSMIFVKADWQTKKIARGIKLRQHWFQGNSLFNSNQFVSVLEVRQRKGIEIDLGVEPRERKATSVFGRQENALAAINGTFFDMKNGGSVDFIRHNGAIVNQNQLLKNGERAVHQQAALVIQNGKLNIEGWDGHENWERGLKGEDVMLSGPFLLDEGKRLKLDSTGFNTTRHPRTAITVTKKGRLLLITVDGRDSNSAGMSLFELASVLRWLDSRDGINMDGGGSTALWVKGQGTNGIVNNPSDDKKWGPEGERKVANVVLVKKR